MNARRLAQGASTTLGVVDAAVVACGVWRPPTAERDDCLPEFRRKHVKLGPSTPPQNPRDEQVWHTYNPVAIDSAQRTIGAIKRPESSMLEQIAPRTRASPSEQ